MIYAAVVLIAVIFAAVLLGFLLHKFTIASIAKSKAQTVVECLEAFVVTSTHNEVDKLKQQFSSLAANLKKLI